MRSKILSALVLSLLPGAALASDYPFLSNSGDWQLMELNNTGSTDKTMLSIYGNTANGTGIQVYTGNYSNSVGVYGMSLTTMAGDYSTARGDQIAVYGGYGTNSDGSNIWVNGGDYSINYGVYANASGTDGSSNYGVYGSAFMSAGSGFTAAGYFDGDVWLTSLNWISDRQFKKDIQDVAGGLNTILALKPRTYTMKKDEYKGKVNLPAGKQIGFIAQEIETVLPELVKDAVAPAHLTPEETKAGVKKDPTKYKSVDYVGVIPVLVAAMQEQQALIETLTAKVAALEAAK